MSARRGTIIIAAHNEEAVIARTLDSLRDVTRSGEVTVWVVCNGCTDRTAEIARGFADVGVLEIGVASKIAALRAGDLVAGAGARIYLDADIVLTSRAATDVVAALADGALAGRPPHIFDSTHADWIVRRWYALRQDLPSISASLWGAGCYAISDVGRARFAEFPSVVSDDLFIHSLFSPAEVTIVDTDPLVVTTPRRAADLVHILHRHYRSQREVSQGAKPVDGRRSQLRDIAAIVRRKPLRLIDAAVYMGVIAFARASTRRNRSTGWERDASSRELV